MSEWFWNWRAGKYDEQAQRDASYAEAAQRFAKYLTVDHTVLDYACGTGVVTFLISPIVKEVHGIDTSAGMIDLAKEHAREREVTNVRFAQQTIFEEGLAPAPYDVILAFNILHLVEDARKVVQRANELVKPGGLLISLTPCLGEAGVILRTLLPLISKVGVLSYLRTLKISEVKALICDGAFQIVESEILAGKIPSWFVVARKQ